MSVFKKNIVKMSDIVFKDKNTIFSKNINR